MELILAGPMLASQPCLHAFWVLTPFPFYLKCYNGFKVVLGGGVVETPIGF